MDISVIEMGLRSIRSSASLLDDTVDYVTLRYWDGGAGVRWVVCAQLAGIPEMRFEGEAAGDVVAEANAYFQNRFTQHQALAADLGMVAA
jgi:hypothetical protein